MSSRAGWLDIVSGSDDSLRGLAARGVLGAASQLYGLAMRGRNAAYENGWKRIERVEVPVVSVGNLTVGGTGKTPTIAWLAHACLHRGRRPAIIARGYGASAGQLNDEGKELQRLVPGVIQVQMADRVAAARRAIAQGADVILMDDGLQHRRLHRDGELVLLDATNPFGFGHLLPRGLLREPIAGLRRAQLVMATRSDRVSSAELDQLQSRVRQLAPTARWCASAHGPQRLRSATGLTQSLESLRGRRVLAVCALGNPAAFFQTVESCGAVVAERLAFADHHHFSAADRDQIAARALAAGEIELIACSGKDLVKLDADRLSDIPLWAVEIALDLKSGQPELEAWLNQILESK